MSNLWNKFQKWHAEYKEAELKLSNPEIVNNRGEYAKTIKVLSALKEKAGLYEEYLEIERALRDVAELKGSSDSEIQSLAKEEEAALNEKLRGIEKRAEDILLADVPDADKDVIIEIRAGTGGLEASLFASDLFKMYSRYAESKGWKLEVLEANATEIGGFKEVVFSLSGDKVYYYMRYESGVHRVQRVPVTEAGGRIHTSAASVVVLIEPEDVDVNINPDELKIDVYRSSGPGGQGVNTTDSAVRITHLPTGIVVTCQDERSQIKNKAKAMRVLKARLLDMEKQKQQNQLASHRKRSIGSGDRSEKIRTYNFPERRVTDHRINFTTYRLNEILSGELDEVIQPLLTAEKELLKQEP